MRFGLRGFWGSGYKAFRGFWGGLGFRGSGFRARLGFGVCKAQGSAYFPLGGGGGVESPQHSRMIALDLKYDHQVYL